MGSRLQLHDQLLSFSPNVYFQPPSSVTMKYPCIVYSKTSKMRHYANDVVYKSLQEYRITVIDANPDSVIGDNIENALQYCEITQHQTINNLNHTYLILFY